jgi:acetoin utilization protein AcuB
MDVEHIMTKDVITVTPDTRVTDAVDIMEKNHFHRLPVIKENKYIGIVTEEEIAENSPSSATSLSIYEMNYLFDKMTVGEIMREHNVTVTPDTLLETAATLMKEQNVTVLPILDNAQHIVGIVTYKDIFKALIDLSGYNDPGSRFLIYIDEDRVGVLAHITQELANADISLSHIMVNRLENQIEITIQTDDETGDQANEVLKNAGYNITRL